MQHDIGESTSRIQMPTLPEPAVVGTRPPQVPPLFHHPHHHSPSTILSPSTNLQGWAWCGETQYPLHPLPSIHSPVQADRKSKERIRGEEEQAEMEEEGAVFHICVSWSPTEILHLEFTGGGIVKTESERRKIKNVEDSGKPVVVFSTNCEFSFCLASLLSQCVKNAQNEQHTLASGQERKRRRKRPRHKIQKPNG